jgi:hypothetical protein
LSDDLEHFRRRADEERRAASLEADPGRRGTHEFLAEKYEKLVELYQRLAPGDNQAGR